MSFKLRYTRSETGATVTTKVRRDADGAWLDFDDDTFKTSGHVADEGALTEPDSTNFPGLYEITLDPTTWSDGTYAAVLAVFAEIGSVAPIELIAKDGVLANLGALTPEEIDAVLSASHGAGSWRPSSTSTGSVPVTIMVKEDDTSGAPIPLVDVQVFSSAGAFLDRNYTGSSGEAEIALDPGSYLVYLQKPGVPYFFTRPETLVVPDVASYTDEYYAIPFVPVVPTGSSLAVIYDYLFNLGIEARPGVEVTVRVSAPNQAYMADGPILTGLERTKTNSRGLFQFSLPRQVDLLTPAVRYSIEIKRLNFKQEFEASDLDAGGAIILSSLSV